MIGQKIARKMMMQMAILVLLYISALLLSAIKFLPNDTLRSALPYPHVSALSHILLELALLCGVLGAAIFTAIEDESRSLLWAYRGWTLFLVVTFLAGAFDMLEGRHMLEIPPLLDIALIVLLIVFMVIVANGANYATGQGKFVWLVGMGVIVTAHFVSLLPVSSILVDRVLRVLTVNMRFNVGYLLAGLAVVYWWPRQLNLFRVAGIAALVGTLASFSPLIAIVQSAISGWIVAVVIIMGWILLMREIIKPSNAQEAWINLGALVLVFSLGVIGSLTSLSTVAAYTQGTLLSNLQLNLTAFGVLFFVIGFARHSVNGINSTRGFWLVAVGLVGGNLALLIAAAAQIIMERVLTIGYLDVQNSLVPFYALWILGLLVMGIGLLWLLLTIILTPQSEN